MYTEIPADQLAAQGAIFTGLPATWAVASIVAGNTAGRLWAAGAARLLWDQGNHVLYLAGAAPDAPTRQALAQLIAGEFRAATLAQGLAHCKIRALSPALAAAIPELLPGVALREAPSVVYRHQGAAPPEPPAPAIAGISIVPITRALLDEPGLARADEVREEIRWMWPDPERFFAAGFGVAARLPDALVGWCTAEYVSPGRCGVGIATAPDFQRRGVAGAMAARFVQACRARDVQPIWETGADNSASRRVAERAGFVYVEELCGWVGRLVYAEDDIGKEIQ